RGDESADSGRGLRADDARIAAAGAHDDDPDSGQRSVVADSSLRSGLGSCAVEFGEEFVELAEDGGVGAGEQGDPHAASAGFAGEEVAAGGAVVDADHVAGPVTSAGWVGACGAEVGEPGDAAGHVGDLAGLGSAEAA